VSNTLIRHTIYAKIVGMNVIDPTVRLGRLVRRCGTQRAAAAHIGISHNYLCDLLHGRRTYSDRVLERLNLRRIIVAFRARRSPNARL
jgi:hypothetical protein